MENTNSQNGADRCCPSQLRYDEVSKDWVVIAPGRGKRPEAYKRQRLHVEMDLAKCPFCNLSIDAAPILTFANGKMNEAPQALDPDWTLAVIPNKFPAFCPASGQNICKTKFGSVYHSMDAAGFCEVIVTRDHNRHIGEMDASQVEEILAAYQARFLALKKHKIVEYISVFHNHGVEAGASQPHPHSQIITSPLIDVDLRNALVNSKKYWRKHKKCLSCEMTAWELEVKERLVCENDDFVAICPFAPKTAFEVIVAPKEHMPYFEKIDGRQRKSLAEVFSTALKKVCKGLGDPPFNFYLHTAPCDGKKYPYYHWHWTIMPRAAVFAGFELGTRMEISTITPESAAEYLRAQ